MSSYHLANSHYENAKRITPYAPKHARVLRRIHTTSRMLNRDRVANHSPRNDSWSPTSETQYSSTTLCSDHEQNLPRIKISVNTDSQQPGKEVVPPGLKTVISYDDQTGDVSWKEVVVDLPITPRRGSRSLILCIIAVLLVGAVVGVGLSFGLTKKSSKTQQAATPAATSTPTPTTVPANVPTTAESAVLLLDDTSFAAFLDSGGRHVFFQTADSSIRHGVFAFSWTFEDTGVRNARNNTPIAVTSADDGTLYLFYITAENNLTSIRRSQGGNWQPFPVNAAPQVDPNTRQLKAEHVQSFGEDSVALHILILTEYPGAAVTTLHLFSRTAETSFEQANIYMMPNVASVPSTSIAAPCGTASNVTSTSTRLAPFLTSAIAYQWVAVCCEKPANSTGSMVGISYNDTSLNSTLFGHLPALQGSVPAASSDLEIVFLDGQLSTLYVSNYTLVVSSGGQATTSNLNFPYARMASYLMLDVWLYVYHQIDHHTFAEDYFDTAVEQWVATNITIQ